MAPAGQATRNSTSTAVAMTITGRKAFWAGVTGSMLKAGVAPMRTTVPFST